MPDFVCIAAPYFIGKAIPGRDETAQLRASGFAEAIGAPWIEVQPDFAAAPDPVTAVNQAIAGAVAAQRDRFPLIFAGDCCCSLGALKGLALDDPGIVWYDAHGDFNTPQTTPSGFLGGMPLAWLVWRGEMDHMQRLGLEPLPESRILISDARDLDPEEGVALRASAVTRLPNVDDLLTAPLPAGPLYVHLDLDVVDSEQMPGHAYPAPGGPSVAQVAATLRRVARDGDVRGLLVSMWNANLAPDDRPLQATLTMLRAFVAGLA